jgi:arginine decarboxylase
MSGGWSSAITTPLTARDQALQMFNLGLLSLEFRGLTERLYWASCARIRDVCRRLGRFPEELEDLENVLSDTYFCNFSIFQSLPDSWAIDQLFPIMPIHRLCELPSRKAVLADITCDSDGKVDRFVGPRDVKRTLELHEPIAGEDYYLGAFLVGAYQETLGDLHNLFGDTTWCTSSCTMRAAGGSRRSSRATPPIACSNTWNTTWRNWRRRWPRDCERAVREGA